MKEVIVKTKPPYTVVVGRGLLPHAGRYMTQVIPPCRAHIIADSNVAPLYAETVAKSLQTAGYQATQYVFPAGEEQKTPRTLLGILESLATAGLTRSDVVVALGGGVTGDIAGFAAAVYLRGIRYVQLPTTLLAAVDSSVGGKTAVDFAGQKNSLGAFHQPSLVLCDCDTFGTLTPHCLGDGLGESIKYGVIKDAALFGAFAGEYMDEIEDIVARCVELKAEIVAADERDTGLRQLLNFGHTPAHAIETLSGYAVSHGHAVAMGMVLMARAAKAAGICLDDTAGRLEALLKTHGLPTEIPYSAFALAQAAAGDKKRAGENITLVVPVKLGQCILHTIPVTDLERFFAAGMEENL